MLAPLWPAATGDRNGSAGGRREEDAAVMMDNDNNNHRKKTAHARVCQVGKEQTQASLERGATAGSDGEPATIITLPSSSSPLARLAREGGSRIKPLVHDTRAIASFPSSHIEYCTLYASAFEKSPRMLSASPYPHSRLLSFDYCARHRVQVTTPTPVCGDLSASANVHQLPRSKVRHPHPRSAQRE